MESFLDGMAYQCTKKGMTSDGIIIGGNWVTYPLIGEFWIAIRINHSNDRNSNRMSFSKRLSQSLDSNGKQKTWRTVTWSRRRRCLCLSWKVRRCRWMSSRSIRSNSLFCPVNVNCHSSCKFPHSLCRTRRFPRLCCCHESTMAAMLLGCLVAGCAH